MGLTIALYKYFPIRSALISRDLSFVSLSVTSMEIHIPFFDIAVVLTWWKVWGCSGALMFTGRWFVQMHYSRKAKHPVLPIGYWVMSLVGSFMLLTYFIFGKNDSVGILSNLFPSFVAGYNLWLELKHRKMNPVSTHA